LPLIQVAMRGTLNQILVTGIDIGYPRRVVHSHDVSAASLWGPVGVVLQFVFASTVPLMFVVFPVVPEPFTVS
jgi:hypothetical protein